MEGGLESFLSYIHLKDDNSTLTLIIISKKGRVRDVILLPHNCSPPRLSTSPSSAP